MKITNECSVLYYLYYDLFFRVKYNFLEPCIYTIDFRDYIQAGIAFNTRGYQKEQRKINFYVSVLDRLDREVNDSIIQQAIKYFYEDLFELYKLFLDSLGNKDWTGGMFAFIPSWDSVTYLTKEHPIEVLTSDDAKDIDSLTEIKLQFINLRPIRNNINQKVLLSLAYTCMKCTGTHLYGVKIKDE